MSDDANRSAHKSAWMNRAMAGTEIAFDLVFRSLDSLASSLGIETRKTVLQNVTDTERLDWFEKNRPWRALFPLPYQENLRSAIDFQRATNGSNFGYIKHQTSNILNL